jgi:hypothetical protein
VLALADGATARPVALRQTDDQFDITKHCRLHGA